MKSDRQKSIAADRKRVLTLAGVGLSRDLIAKRVGCSVAELESRYANELKRALPEMKAMVGGKLFEAAKKGKIAAIIFWLKTRAGWRETIHRDIIETEILPPPAKPQARAFLPCNGRCARPKIADPHERRAYYEHALQRKLPVGQPSEYPERLSDEERSKFYSLLMEHVNGVDAKLRK